MFVGLVKDPGWDGRFPPDEFPESRRPHSWRIPWRVLAWLGIFVALLACVPFVGHVFGALAGYGLILVAVAVGGWRLDRELGPPSRGLRDYRQGF